MEPIPRQHLTIPNGSLERLITTVPLEELLAQWVDVGKFLPYCQACPNYGKRWSCPPFQFDPMDLWRGYKALVLVALVLIPAAGTDPAVFQESVRLEKNKLLEDLLALEETFPGSLALAAGSCDLCRFCARETGQPCRRPNQLRCSMEALGGDVAGIAEEYLGRALQWSRAGDLPDALTLVGGLLIPKG